MGSEPGRQAGAPGPAHDAPPTRREAGAGKAGDGGAAAALAARGPERPGRERRVRGERRTGGPRSAPPTPPLLPLPEGRGLRGRGSPPAGASLQSSGLRVSVAFSLCPLHTPSLFLLSSDPSPQAEGGAGETRGAGPRPDSDHPRGPGRRGREPGMEARRAETQRAGSGIRSPSERGVCGCRASSGRWGQGKGGAGQRGRAPGPQSLSPSPRRTAPSSQARATWRRRRSWP